MTNDRMVKILYNWEPICTRFAGRPKFVWENDIKEDLRIMEINNWTKCIQVRVKWKESPKLSNSEVVAPDDDDDVVDEEEEEEEEAATRTKRGSYFCVRWSFC
jgi:hypothetical protein